MRPATKYILIGIGIILFFFILWVLRSVVAYVVAAAVVSLLGHPIVNRLNKLKIGEWIFPRALAAGLTLIFFWALLFSFGSVFVPLVSEQASNVASVNVDSVMRNLNKPIARLEKYINKKKLTGNQKFSFQKTYAEKIMSVLNISQISNFFGSIASLLGNIFIAVFSISFISYFLLKGKNLFLTTSLLIFPQKYSEKLNHTFDSISYLLRRYFLGLLIQSTLIIILIGTGLWICGLDINISLTIALIAGVLNIIPYIGPLIGFFVGVVLVVLTHLNVDFYDVTVPLLTYLMIVFAVARLIDDIVFQPYIYSSSVKAQPLEIFLVILCAGTLSGITGMILAIPCYTILRAIGKEFFNNLRFIQKLTENM